MENESKLRTFGRWYTQTSMLLGIPILLMLLSIGIQKLFFTATCQVAGFRCEYSLGADEAMASYMGELIASNRDQDIVVKRR